MGRRAARSPDELRQLMLDAAQQIIEKNGLAGLSAREVARKIGYSPGSLYNKFDDLDDLILHVEARLLGSLDERLAAAMAGSVGEEAVRRFARAHLAFSHERPRLWNVLFEHHLPHTYAIPQWYQDKIETTLGRLQRAMAPLVGSNDPAEVRRCARALWAAVHGVTSLSTANKVCHVTIEGAGELLDDLVDCYLAGLAQRRRS